MVYIAIATKILMLILLLDRVQMGCSSIPPTKTNEWNSSVRGKRLQAALQRPCCLLSGSPFLLLLSHFEKCPNSTSKCVLPIQKCQKLVCNVSIVQNAQWVTFEIGAIFEWLKDSADVWLQSHEKLPPKKKGM